MVQLRESDSPMRLLTPIVFAVFAMAGCAGSPTASIAPTALGAAAGGGSTVASLAGQQISVDQAVVSVGCFFPSSGSFTASTNFDGVITAVSDAPDRCTVSPASQEPVVTPGSGGTKRATFTVTATNLRGCTVTVTDKKGHTATVIVAPNYEASTSCFL
jgi:hypothetical protein